MSPDIEQSISNDLVMNTATLALEGDINVIPNDGKTLFLCFSKSEPVTSFIVTDLNGNIIHAREVIRGQIRWQDAESLLVTDSPGVIEDPTSKVEPSSRIIFLKSEKI